MTRARRPADRGAGLASMAPMSRTGTQDDPLGGEVPARPRRRAGPLAWLAALGALLVVLGMAGRLVSRAYGVGVFRRPFDAERWQAPESRRGEQRARRWAMSLSLVKRHLRTGMTRAEVEAMLGPPDADPVLAAPQKGDWLYMLGATPWEKVRMIGWSLTGSGDDVADFEEVSSILTFRALVVGFGAGGRVNRFEIIER